MTEAFCRASVKIALAQLLNSMGFSGAEESALDILTDIYIKQIEEVWSCSCLTKCDLSSLICKSCDIVRCSPRMGRIFMQRLQSDKRRMRMMY